MNINEIFAKYGSDKGSGGHEYGGFYETWLPKKPKKILEIGVYRGSSIRAWKEIFPEAEIHALDLFVLDPIPEIEDVHFWKGNQCDQTILHALRKENFDLILEDCSHNTREQLVTFFSLAQKGCHYFIEDLHTETNPFFNTGLPEAFWPTRLMLHASSKVEISNDGKIIYIQC